MESMFYLRQLGHIDPTVAGIDIGEQLIHIAIPDGKGSSTVEEFGTTTPQLYQIASRLKEAGVVTAVMESTGVFCASSKFFCIA